MRATNCTTVPKKKAMATDRKMPRMTESAFSVFNRSLRPSPVVSEASLSSDTTKVAPSSSNTIDTVVEVGIPSVLKTSSRMTSVTITAMKMQIRS